MTEPKVSIAMPVYNGEEFIAQAIDAHLAQTYGDFELVVCDNASEDNTQDICQAYVKQDPRVRYVRNQVNRGANANFNIGFAQTAAPYMRWAAADDLITPGYLAATVDVLDTRPDVVLAHSQSEVIDRFGEPMLALRNGFLDPDGFVEHFAVDPPPADGDVGADRPSERIRAVVRSTRRMSFVFGLTRREALLRTLLHRPFYGADKVLMVELLLQGKFVELDERLFQRRCHQGNSNRIAVGSEGMAQFGAGDKAFVVKMLHAYLSSINEAELSTSERLRCAAVVASKVTTPLRTYQGR